MTTSDLAIELLPARHGDAILLEWPEHAGCAGSRTRRMLVDCGPAAAYADVARRLSHLDSPHIDRLVLTHIDADHIEGMILAVNDANLSLDIGEIWYNGYSQLSDELKATQGEILSALIDTRQLRWNDTFNRRAVRATDADQLLTRVELPGGVVVTVLAPTQCDLRALQDHWDLACKEAGLNVGSIDEALQLLRHRPNLNPLSTYLGAESPDIDQLARDRRGADKKVPNASSIVLLVEHDDRRILLAGDSTPSVLISALRRLLEERGVDRLELTDFKLPHHGSANNISREILELVPAHRYLFSTDGSYFGHPDDEAVATVIRHGRPGAELVFNYSKPRTRKWDLENLRNDYGYSVRYPTPGTSGVRL
jgi:beta-lactamase superfamily II metal-dependent hydrolase